MVAYWTGSKRSWFAALESLLTSIAVVCVLGGGAGVLDGFSLLQSSRGLQTGPPDCIL